MVKSLQDGEPRDQRSGRPAGFPQTLLHQRDRLSTAWNDAEKMRRRWRNHGEIIGSRWEEDGTIVFWSFNCCAFVGMWWSWSNTLGVWWNMMNLEYLDRTSLPITPNAPLAKDNYRESAALTKKVMALKGKGESKTVTWPWPILALPSRKSLSIFFQCMLSKMQHLYVGTEV